MRGGVVLMAEGFVRKMLTQNSEATFTFGCAPTTYWLELEYILTVSLNVPQDKAFPPPLPHGAGVRVWRSTGQSPEW